MSNLLKRDNLFLLVTNPSCRCLRQWIESFNGGCWYLQHGGQLLLRHPVWAQVEMALPGNHSNPIKLLLLTINYLKHYKLDVPMIKIPLSSTPRCHYLTSIRSISPYVLREIALSTIYVGRVIPYIQHSPTVRHRWSQFLPQQSGPTLRRFGDGVTLH